MEFPPDSPVQGFIRGKWGRVGKPDAQGKYTIRVTAKSSDELSVMYMVALVLAVSVNILTLTADLAGGAAALELLTGLPWRSEART